MEALGADEDEGGLHGDEGELVEETHEVGPANGGVVEAEDGAQGIAQAGFGGALGGVGGQGFAEAGAYPEDVEHAEREGDERGHGEGVNAPGGEAGPGVEQVEFRAEGSYQGAGDEAEAEGGTDEAHGLAAFGPGSDVGDGGGGDGEVAAEEPGQHAGGKEEPKTAAHRPERVTEGGAGHGVEQNGAAADPVGERAPEGREDELEDGKDGGDDAAEEHLGQVGGIAQVAGEVIDAVQQAEEQAGLSVDGKVVAEQVGAERENDGEPDQIDVEGKENDSERKGPDGSGGSGWRGGSGHVEGKAFSN